MKAILEQRSLLPALLLSLSLLAPSRGWAHQVPIAVRDLTLMGFLTSWNFRAEVMLVLAVLAGAYMSGWWRLQKQGQRGTARGWQAATYLAGLMVLGLALLSPIDRFASALFTLHMVQHLLLMMAIAPLLLLADPLPAVLWALPRRVRRRIGQLLSQGAMVRRGLWAVTWMPVSWLLFVGTLWAWHHPAAYQAALRHEVIHDLEHLTFFGTAQLFWWPIINPAPRVHGRLHPGHPTLHILYLRTAATQTVALGALIALPQRVLYPFYAAAPCLWGLSPLNDQALGGGIMWVAAHMCLLPILLVVARLLKVVAPALAILALLAYGLTRDPRAIPTPLLAKPATPFTLPLFDGRQLSLEELRGQVLQAGHGDAALLVIERALTKEPNYPLALWSKGLVLFEHKQDYAGAISVWETLMAANLAPANADALAQWIVTARQRLAAQAAGLQQEPKSQGTISGTVTLPPSLQTQVPSEGMLFIIARQGDGPTLAVKRIPNPIFPVAFSLGRDGTAGPSVSGDLEGKAEMPVKVGQQGVEIVLDQDY